MDLPVRRSPGARVPQVNVASILRSDDETTLKEGAMCRKNLDPNHRKQKCFNCGVPCSGSFCCEWCVLTYAQRSVVHGHRANGKKRTGNAPLK